MSVTLTTGIDGLESLTFGERLKVFFKELSLGIDTLNAKYLNSSIHTVKTGNVFSTLKEKNEYFNISSNQIPTPVFFNPNKSTFREYVQFCINSAGLLISTMDEADKVYNGLKSAVNKQVVPYGLRNFQHIKVLETINNDLVSLFSNTGVSSRDISEVYSNFNSAEETIEYFNSVVKDIKSRDAEILKKKIDLIVDLIKLIKLKIENNDISLRDDDRLTIELSLNRLNEMVTMTGKLLNLTSELSKVLELQVKAFSSFK